MKPLDIVGMPYDYEYSPICIVILGVEALGHVGEIKECELSSIQRDMFGVLGSVSFILHFWDMFNSMSLCGVLEISVSDDW